MMNRFLQERECIGEGRLAKVYRWNGYAYKCFAEGYTQAWMEQEYRVNQIIHSAGIPCAAYYPSEFPNSLKMELLSGETLFGQMLAAGNPEIPEIYYDLLGQIHSVRGLPLPSLRDTLRRELTEMDFDAGIKAKALDFLEQLPDGDCLCHMDYHGYNILCTKDGPRVIDWMTACIGNPVLDLARTYTLHYEADAGFGEAFLQAVCTRFDVPETDMRKAAYIMALKRQNEFRSGKCLALLRDPETAL